MIELRELRGNKMTNKDKVIATFLVSVGIFSAGVANKYVSSLSMAQKNSILPIVKSSGQMVLLAETYRPTEGDPKRG